MPTSSTLDLRLGSPSTRKSGMITQQSLSRLRSGNMMSTEANIPNTYERQVSRKQLTEAKMCNSRELQEE